MNDDPKQQLSAIIDSIGIEDMIILVHDLCYERSVANVEPGSEYWGEWADFFFVDDDVDDEGDEPVEG